MDFAAADGLCFPVLYHKIGIRLLHVRVNHPRCKKKKIYSLENTYIKTKKIKKHFLNVKTITLEKILNTNYYYLCR